MAFTTSTRYANQSVFDLPVNVSGQVGTQDIPQPEPIRVAVVEFDDNGTFVDRRQIERAETCIDHARRNNLNGAVVVVFVHGWHHDASWGTERDDAHFSHFRQILNALALRELERWTPGGEFSFPQVDSRTVIGVYLGWNGEPANCWLSRRPVLTHLTFCNRYDTAMEISKGHDIRETIRRIHASSKKPLDRKPGDATPIRADCPLILIGHSMGALILESAFLALLKDKERPFLRIPQEPVHNGYVEIRHDNELVSFPDLLLALNSAADSEIAREICQELDDLKLTKTISAGDIGYSPPLFISLTSTADRATKWIWRFAQLLKRRKWRTTDGHDQTLVTHTFKRLQENVPCEAKSKIRDFGQDWHCLRPPRPRKGRSPSFNIDLPSRLSDRGGDRSDHDKYGLEPAENRDRTHLMWLFQVPPDIIRNHNDIFNSRSSLLIMALLQISGSVMSLAEGWKDNFEEEPPLVI